MNLKQLIESTDNKDSIRLVIQDIKTNKIVDFELSRKYLNRNKKDFSNCDLNIIWCEKI